MMLTFSGAVALTFAVAGQSSPADTETLTVVANRTEQSVQDVLAAVTVIDRAQIDAAMAADLSELLRQVPGVDVVRTGPLGGQTSIFMRGTNSNHVLVLVDGVRVASPIRSSFNFENLPLAMVERIEILRGPRATLYGSDAIGGVIHITTRQDAGSGARVSAGSFATIRGSAWAGAAGDSGAFSALISHDRSDGFSAQNPSGFSFNPDDDGFRNTSLLMRFKQNLGARHQLIGTILHSDGESEFDQGVTDMRNRVFSIGLEGHLKQNLFHRLALNYADDELETAAFFSRADAKRQALDYLMHINTAAGTFSTGLSARSDEGESVGSYSADRENYGVFGGYSGQHQALNYDISARFDDNSEFGSQFTAQAALGYAFTDQWQGYVSYGSTFRAPSMGEQFSPGFGGLFAGNPNLNPEYANGAELGMRYVSGNTQLAAHVFDLDIKDLVSFTGILSRAINIDKAQTRGLEVSWDQRWSRRWSSQVTATLQDAENARSGVRLARRPDEKLSVEVQYAFDQGFVALDGFYSSSREDFGVTLDGYALLGVRGGWDVSPKVKLGFRLENLLNEQYQLANGFNTADRSGTITASFTFQ